MLVALYNVSLLLCLPIVGQFCNIEELEYEEAHTTIVGLLGVDRGRASAEMTKAHSPKVRVSWLKDIYVEHYEE